MNSELREKLINIITERIGVNDPRSANEQKESADETGRILAEVEDFPQEKIEAVKYAIEVCSFSKGIMPDTLEAKVIQDADRLESTGLISVFRTFTTGALMGRIMFNSEDAHCENREPDTSKYSLDLFYTRLLKVKDTMHTDLAKEIAESRTEYLEDILKQLAKELRGE